MDEFDHWMTSLFTPGEGGVRVEPIVLAGSTVLTPEQVRRLIAFLHRLSGHAPGTLPPAELEAIRARARASAEGHTGGEPPAMRHVRAHRDRDALLAHADALAADLAAAEEEVEGLRLLVTDLVHPEGDGREAPARCYRAGVEWERARCAALLRLAAGDWRRALPQAADRGQRQRGETVVAALEDAADLVEKGE